MRKFLGKLCFAPLLFLGGIIAIPFLPFLMGRKGWEDGLNTASRLMKALVNFVLGCLVCWLAPLALLYWLFFEYDTEG